MSLCLEQLTWPLLLDSMSEAVWLVDADSLQILHANRAACYLTQLPVQASFLPAFSGCFLLLP